MGTGVEWAAAQAERAIHDNDVERLKHLLAEHPALLSWRGEDGDSSLFGMSTGSFGDSFDPDGARACFDESGAAGQPALGDLNRHHPVNHPDWRANLHWGTPTVQHVLDVALAWACMNRHFEVASFLLEHGADINTNWSTHEPAGMLHECAVQGNYEAARFLIDRGIDMTRLDYRWNGTAEGWPRYAANDEQMADFLAAAERQRNKEPG